MAVLSTGDEVKDPAAVALGPGQVRDANRAMLMAAVSEAGALAQDLGIAGDTEEESTAAFRRALDGGADVMLITGGLHLETTGAGGKRGWYTMGDWCGWVFTDPRKGGMGVDMGLRVILAWQEGIKQG